MSTTTPDVGQRVALSAIHTDGNVRDLDLMHVDALAGSIALRGLIVPLAVKPADDGRFTLVAGFHRHAACAKLGLDEVPVTVRVEEGATADRAAENVVRKDLSPLEEARAVRAMLDEGYTLDGAASVLGWSRQLVTARVKLLELPETAQMLIGTGAIPVSAVDALLRINAVAPALVELLAQAVTDEVIAGGELARDVGWALGRAMSGSEFKVFATYLNSTGAREVEALRLGKKTEALLAEAEKLHKQLDRYAYGPPTIRFSETEIDQARAAGVLIELERAQPIIVDRSLYRELCKQAIGRTVAELRDRQATQAKQQAELRADRQDRPRSEREQAVDEHRQALRELTVRAHGVNLDLGAALLTELSVVDPTDVDVAKFFAYGVLGPDHLGPSGDVTRTIAMNGIRLVVEGLRSTDTPTLKSGKPGKTKVTYAEFDDAQAWLWKYIEGGKTAGEIYGRTLVAFAAMRYATALVLPNSERRSGRPARLAQGRGAQSVRAAHQEGASGYPHPAGPRDRPRSAGAPAPPSRRRHPWAGGKRLGRELRTPTGAARRASMSARLHGRQRLLAAGCGPRAAPGTLAAGAAIRHATSCARLSARRPQGGLA